MRTAFLVLLFSVSSAAILRASSLKWEQTTVALEAQPSDKKAEAVFTFSNTSAVPVEIRSVKTSCGCTTVGLDKRVYGPGESGAIKAVFNFGGRKGRQQKTIVVHTAEKDAEPDVLLMRVNIPEGIRVNKEKLTWQVGDPLEAQAFEITVVKPDRGQVKSVRPLGKNFEAALEEMESGKRYRVVVRPLSTETPAKGTVRLEVADPGNRLIYLPVVVEP